MNDAAAPPTYVARANVLEYDAIWRLAPDALELQGVRRQGIPKDVLP